MKMKYLLEANYPNVKEMYFITMPLVKWDLPEKQSDNSM